MKCITPRFLPVPGSVRIDDKVPVFARDLIRPHSGFIQVPCGKCIACLRNRQQAVISRVYAEADKRGSFAFITLTYDEEHLPLAETVYRCDVETGECERVGLPFLDKDSAAGLFVARKEYNEAKSEEEKASALRKIREAFQNERVDTKPRIIHCARSKDMVLSDEMRSIRPGRFPRYIDRPLFNGLVIGGYSYFARVTPSSNREDVRLWIKQFRTDYERKHGYKCDFSYACCVEYGPRTCRPHYHICILGISRADAEDLLSRWNFGKQKDLKMVNRVNGDGSDGFKLASQYIGKYITKGRFECPSVKDCNAEKPRLLQSIGLGKSLADKLRETVFCYDLFGYYNPETLEFGNGLRMTPEQFEVIAKEMPKRLTYVIGINEKTGKPIRYPIPKIIRNRIFTIYDEKIDSQGKVRLVARKDSDGNSVVSPVWRLVSLVLQGQFMDHYRDEFEAFARQHLSWSASKICSEFDANKSNGVQSAEAFRAQTLESFYAKSLF